MAKLLMFILLFISLSSVSSAEDIYATESEKNIIYIDTSTIKDMALEPYKFKDGTVVDENFFFHIKMVDKNTSKSKHLCFEFAHFNGMWYTETSDTYLLDRAHTSYRRHFEPLKDNPYHQLLFNVAYAYKKNKVASVREKIVDIATQYVDVPYRNGILTTNPNVRNSDIIDNNFDYVEVVFKEAGYFPDFSLSLYPYDPLFNGYKKLFNNGVSIGDSAQLEDLVFFGNDKNEIVDFGIFVGDGKYAHLSKTEKRIIIEKIADSNIKDHRLCGSKRYIEKYIRY